LVTAAIAKMALFTNSPFGLNSSINTQCNNASASAPTSLQFGVGQAYYNNYNPISTIQITIRKRALHDYQLQQALNIEFQRFDANILSDSRVKVELDLSHNQLTTFEFPDWLYSKLIRLNLSSNKIEQLPLVITKCNGLEYLNLSRNSFKGSFPRLAPMHLPLLKYLNISENYFTSLPVTLKYLSNLEELTVGTLYGGNLLTEFPSACISYMKKLRYLDLSNNRLTSLPPDLGRLNSSLQVLNVSSNRLVSIPRSIGLLSQLRILDLSSNCLHELPIELVDLNSLQTLDVSRNRLCIIPGDVAEFMKKTTMLLVDNPLTSISNQMGSIGDFTSTQANIPEFNTPSCSNSTGEFNSPRLVPSLKELAARVVLGESIPVATDQVTRSVYSELNNGARPCSYCQKPYVSESLEYIEYRDHQGHPTIPTKIYLCSTSCWNSVHNVSTNPIPAGLRQSVTSSRSQSRHASGVSSPYYVNPENSSTGSVPRAWKLRQNLNYINSKLSQLEITSNSSSPASSPNQSPSPAPLPIPVQDMRMIPKLNDW
jgi:Leucine-rich repeat (LRR) protein